MPGNAKRFPVLLGFACLQAEREMVGPGTHITHQLPVHTFVNFLGLGTYAYGRNAGTSRYHRLVDGKYVTVRRAKWPS